MAKRTLLSPAFRQSCYTLMEWIFQAMHHQFFLFSRKNTSFSTLGLEQVLEEDFSFIPSPLRIEIPPTHVLRTSLDLPLPARRHLHEAIALRLESLSPWHIHDTLWAIEDKNLLGNRIIVHVALTQKAPIDQAKEKTHLFVHRRVIESTNNGRSSVFEEHFSRHNEWQKSRWPQVTTFTLCLIASLWAYSQRTEHQVHEQKEALIAYSHFAKHVEREAQSLKQSIQAYPTNSTTPLREQLQLLSKVLEALPQQTWVSEVDLKNEEVIIDAHHASDAIISIDERLFTRKSTSKPYTFQLIYRAQPHDLAKK